MEPFNKLLEPLEMNSGLNRLALLITAAAQSASATSGSLSLYHANPFIGSKVIHDETYEDA